MRSSSRQGLTSEGVPFLTVHRLPCERLVLGLSDVLSRSIRLLLEVDGSDTDHSIGAVAVDLVDHAFAGAGPVGQFPVGVAELGAGLKRDCRVAEVVRDGGWFDADLLGQTVDGWSGPGFDP